MGWEKVAASDEFSIGKAIAYQYRDQEIAVFSTESGTRAVGGRCPHRGVSFMEGSVEGCVLTCGAHFWKYDLQSGECQTNSDPEFQIKTYKTKEEEGFIWIYFSEF